MKPIPILQLLRLLREETDEQHPMAQQTMRAELKQRDQIDLSRKTVKAYLDALLEAGIPLHWKDVPRINPDGRAEMLRTDWYLEPEFENSEIQLLLDLLASVPAMPEKQRGELEEKIRRHGPVSIREQKAASAVTFLRTPPARQLMYSVEQLCAAMKKDRKVRFEYCRYELDESGTPVLKPRRWDDGSIKEYIVSPYRVAISNGKYYLVCRTKSHENLFHFRIDRIQEIQLLKEKRAPLSEILPVEGEKGQDPLLPRYPAEHLYMFAGPSEPCVLEIDETILSDIIDWFGQDVQIERSEKAGKLLVRLRVQQQAMQFWALQYGSHVTVLEPESLRNDLSGIIKDLAERYQAE